MEVFLMKNKLNIFLTLSFIALLSLQTKSQAYVEKNDTYFVSDEGTVHNTRIGAAIDDTFNDKSPRYHTRSYCRRNSGARGC